MAASAAWFILNEYEEETSPNTPGPWDDDIEILLAVIVVLLIIVLFFVGVAKQ